MLRQDKTGGDNKASHKKGGIMPFTGSHKPAIRLPLHRKPLHPGINLSQDYMRLFHLSIAELARMTGLSRKCLGMVCRGLKPVTIHMAIPFSRLFNTTVEFWLMGQMVWDIWHETRDKNTQFRTSIHPLDLRFEGKGASERWVPLDALTEDERQRLVQLNSTLFELEKKIIIAAKRLIKECKQRLKRPKENFLKDYEIEAMIKFVLDEDDPDYRDEDDNIIAELGDVYINPNTLTLADGDNYNDSEHTEDRMHHCWLYHSLYSHTMPRLTFRDMLRIGGMWVDIVVWYQDIIRLDKNMSIVKHITNMGS